MPEVKPGPDAPLRLNHVEFAHRPGEAHLVVALIEALGCGWYEVDAPPYGSYIVIRLDQSDHGANDMFASVAEPEQLRLEESLAERLRADSELARAVAGLRQLQAERPYRASHVGLRLASVAALDHAIERLTALADGPLAGRLALGKPTMREPEEARATSSPLKQLWIGTDVISTGLLTFGQQIELQAYTP